MMDIGEASHRLCAAFHNDGIDPANVEIHLPREAWWHLYCRLESLQFFRSRHFDGRGALPISFVWMGITYRPKEQP